MTTAETIPFGSARVRIKRDVLFTKTSDGVLFHNAYGGFHLAGRSAYQFATLIVPYLNGQHQVRELCELVPPAHQAMISSLARMLLERGLARDIPAGDGTVLAPAVHEQFREQVDYIDHYENDPAGRFLRFRDARVAVLGPDAIAGWCALSLIRNGAAHVSVNGSGDLFDQAVAEARTLAAAGCAAEVVPAWPAGQSLSWADLDGVDLVVCTGRQVPAQVVALLRDGGVPVGKGLLPVTVYGHRAVVGPLLKPGQTGCWGCAMLRLGANLDAGAAADVWRTAATGEGGGDQPGREQSALLGNLLSYEVFRELTQLMPAETDGSIVLQEFDSFDTSVSAVLPHPRCPFCAPARRTAEAGVPAAFAAMRPGPPADSQPSAGDGDQDAAIAELDALSAATVNAFSGVFTEFDDDWPVQLPLRVSRLTIGLGAGRRRTVTAFDLHHVAGARMRAIRAAAAVYLDLVAPGPASPQDGPPAVDAARLATFSGVADAAAAGPWVLVQSMSGAAPALVPLAAVRPYGPANSAGVFDRSGAGLGFGASVADATYRALFSAVGHLALQLAIRGTTRAAVIDHGLEADPELTFLTHCARDIGAEVELLRLEAGGRLPVLLARARDGAGRPLWSVGADQSPDRAAKIALRDVIGQHQVLAQREADLDLGHRLLASFDPYTIKPAASEPLGAVPPQPVGDLLGSLRDAGHEAYALLDDSPDLRQAGLRAVRVLLTVTERA